MAPSWAAFLGLTGFLVVAMLVLARLSQAALEREPSPTAVDAHHEAAADPTPRRVPPLDPSRTGPAAGDRVDGVGQRGDDAAAVDPDLAEADPPDSSRARARPAPGAP